MSSLCHVDCGDAGVEQLLGMSLGFSRAPSWLDCLFFSQLRRLWAVFFLCWNLYFMWQMDPRQDLYHIYHLSIDVGWNWMVFKASSN